MMGKRLMNREGWNKYNLSPTLWAIVFLIGTGCMLESPAQALPEIGSKATKDSFQLAQIGVSSPNNAPIPLNLRPRTHIPLPTDSRSSDDDYSSGYYDGYHDGYHDSYDDGYHRGGHRDRHRKDTVIIINPARSTYESYDNSDNNQRRYIRIIRNEVSF